MEISLLKPQCFKQKGLWFLTLIVNTVAQEIQVDITTEKGRIFPFSFLTINQRFNGHHSFELRFNHDVLEKPNAVILEKAKDYLGSTITFTLKSKESSSYPDNIF